MIPLFQTQQITHFEKNLFDSKAYTAEELMERAGDAAFNTLLQHWPYASNLIVFCGKGNNGGDGFVLARRAHEKGLQVQVYSTIPLEAYQGEAARAVSKLIKSGVLIEAKIPDEPLFADVIVDALLGIGLKGEVVEPYVSLIHLINQTKIPVLAIDVPSGLEANTGQVLGCAVHADVTLTFIALKAGLFTGKASGYCGRLLCHNLDISDAYLNQLEPFAMRLTWNQVKPVLSRRQRFAHKGNYGHVLVIGGDYGMGGAVRMAAEAAMRVGAGLVSVATRPEHVSIVSGSRPEIMCHQVISAENLEPILEKATVIIIGPGLGKTEWAEGLLNKALKMNVPKVLDADALNLLALLPLQRDDWVLTPHPGEAARLLGCSIKEIDINRFAAVAELQRHYHGVVVLKGSGTLIQSKEAFPVVCTEGNPGMATGGMGDILSGIIGGLLAQGLSLKKAAEAGVLIHALAADKAAKNGGERGLLATDLLVYLRELVNPQ